MPITGKYSKPAEQIDVDVKAIIDFNSKEIVYIVSKKKSPEVLITNKVNINQGKFTALKNILKPDIESIPDISDVEFEFNK